MNQHPAITTVASGSFLRLVKAGTWEYVQRCNASGVVAIAALTRNQEIVLVEQYRPALRCQVIELPAGLVGDEPGHADEALAKAAGRELEEETGFRAGSLRLAMRGPSSAGLSDEIIDFFVATDLERCAPGGGVAGENITVHVVALAQLDAWLRDRQTEGMLIDPKIHAGLWLLQHQA